MAKSREVNGAKKVCSISVRLSDAEDEQLGALAREAGVSSAFIVRRALREYVTKVHAARVSGTVEATVHGRLAVERVSK